MACGKRHENTRRCHSEIICSHSQPPLGCSALLRSHRREWDFNDSRVASASALGIGLCASIKRRTSSPVIPGLQPIACAALETRFTDALAMSSGDFTPDTIAHTSPSLQHTATSCLSASSHELRHSCVLLVARWKEREGEQE